VDATDAWDVRTSADGIIVAVVDSGIRYTHQDLSANMWHNPGEVPGNFSDDDGNGYVDDVFGINTAAGNGNPNDDYGHGTHVAGIIGAKGFNGVGVAGVCWSIQLMACKFVDQQGNGWISDAVTCIDYARSKGAKVINFSWGDTDFTSQALYDAIAAARSAGIIVTAACGNESLNNDIYPLFPASYDLDNIVSVAATTRRDELAGFSCYGPTTVDLGAPGDEIFSCWNGGNSSYQYLAGTSMAAPMVAGACALVWSQHPSENYNQIIARILNNVDPLPELEGKCVSGGRLNVKKALDGVPPATVTVAASDNTATIGTSDTASFTLTRDGNTSGGLTVHFQFSGTAVKWDDYRRPEGDIPESLAIPAGQSSATLTILALTNSTGANPQTVVLTLQANGSYIVGSPNSATVTLASPPAPHIESIASVSSDGIVIRWSSFPGARYQVQDKSDLAASLWQDLSGVITATATTTSWTNNIAGVRQRYYIVKLMN
jgi:subtilisin family serine protease